MLLSLFHLFIGLFGGLGYFGGEHGNAFHHFSKFIYIFNQYKQTPVYYFLQRSVFIEVIKYLLLIL